MKEFVVRGVPVLQPEHDSMRIAGIVLPSPPRLRQTEGFCGPSRRPFPEHRAAFPGLLSNKEVTQSDLRIRQVGEASNGLLQWRRSRRLTNLGGEAIPFGTGSAVQLS